MPRLIWNVAIRDEGYLRRWGYKGKWVTIYVHRYAGGDTGEQMHNHPWQWWASWVLRGRLTEQRLVWEHLHVTVIRDRWSWTGRLPGSAYHRIDAAAMGTLTLFVGWRRCRTWKFIDE